MSQILDAINKAEKARQSTAEQQNQDKTSRYKHLTQSQNKKNAKLLPLSLVFLACVAGTAYTFYNKEINTIFSSSTQSENTPAKTTNNLAKETKTPEATNEPTLTFESLNKAREASVESIAAQKITDKATQKKAAANPDKQKPKLTELTAVKKAQQPSKLSELKPIAKPKPKKPTAVAQKTTKTPTANHPKKADKTPASRPSIASWKKNIKINAIVYNNQASSRFALISGKKVFEGNKIPGTENTVIKIMPQGLIVNDGKGDVLITSH